MTDNKEPDFKEWALKYAALGFAVFPLKPHTKVPATPDGFKSATTDVEQIKSWWTAAPYNIGIATGAASGNLLVIDLDVDRDKGKDGKRAATQWLKEYGKDFPKTAIARTGRGGLHMIFYGNGRNKTNLLPGVDVRGEGGYIVAPPSIHPNGNIYQWLSALKIAAADDTVYAFINQSESKAREAAPKGDAIPEGQRTNALIRLIGSLKAKGLSNEAIEAAVTAENNSCCNPPLTDQELIYQVFPAIYRGWETERPYIKDSKRKNWNSWPPEHNTKPISLMNLEETEEKTPEWLISGYIPKRKITVLAGDGGAGKTTIWCAIAAAVSSGRPCFLDQDNPFMKQAEPGKVLFFSSEDSAEYTLRGRIRRAGGKLGNVSYLNLTDSRFSEIKFNAPLLGEIIETYKPTLVIFDPIQSFIPPDVQMGQRNAMRACLNPLVGLGEKYNVTFLIIVHTNKQMGVWGRKRIADSSDIWDVARSVLIAGETGDNVLRYVSQEKCNDAPLSQTVLFRLDTGKVEFEGYTDRKDKDFVTATQAAAHQAPARDTAKEFILDYLKDGAKETSDLDEVMKAMGISIGTLKRAKADLKTDGKLEYFNEGFGPSKKYYCKLSGTE